MPPLKVALVGCGKIANSAHLPSYRALGGRVVLAALCDTNTEAAKGLAQKYKAQKIYSDYSEMLGAEHYDIVDICTPPYVHKKIAIAAAEAGCNVFVEKPMALNIEDCDEMIAVAERAGVRLCVNHNQVFHRPLLNALERIRRGELGQVVSVHISYILKHASYLSKDHWTGGKGGNVILETFPHPIYISMALIGGIRHIRASARKRTDLEWMNMDDFNVELEGDTANSTIYMGHKTTHWRYWVDILGTERSLTVDMLNSWVVNNRMHSMRIVTKNMVSLRNAATFLGNTFNEGLRIKPKYWLNSHETIIERLVRAIETGGTVPAPGEQGRDVMKVAIEIARQLQPNNQ